MGSLVEPSNTMPLITVRTIMPRRMLPDRIGYVPVVPAEPVHPADHEHVPGAEQIGEPPPFGPICEPGADAARRSD